MGHITASAKEDILRSWTLLHWVSIRGVSMRVFTVRYLREQLTLLGCQAISTLDNQYQYAKFRFATVAIPLSPFYGLKSLLFDIHKRQFHHVYQEPHSSSLDYVYSIILVMRSASQPSCSTGLSVLSTDSQS